MSEIKFDRTPYKVSYVDQKGQKQTIRRVPPPKLHEALPTDVVELTRKKNDDWDAGGDFVVKGINPRQPNTLQLENEDGQTTFVSYYDAKLIKKNAAAHFQGEAAMDLEEVNRYLLWP
ncbi:MAG: hypothetical protein KBD78_04840 [Oligoflexales bacterium]|nr:hypothetical protein [Oligoflexales bacterium]